MTAETVTCKTEDIDVPVVAETHYITEGCRTPTKR